MIHLLLGASGSGKSYEAVVYQILIAVKSGRRVVTNMPLLLDAWSAIDSSFPDLIELRKKPLPIRGTWEPTREEGAFNCRPPDEWEAPQPLARCFSGVWDYYTEWRHPVTKQGPLFVIDEAQNVIPYRETERSVEEWVALHRHWGVDCLYLTQSYGKLSQSIRENVQMVYRFRKKVAWGQPTKYIRKVQDGLRGEVLNVGEREYEKQYFPLYRSHTQGAAVDEAMAADIRPWWKHWSFLGASACFVILIVFFLAGGSLNPIPKPKPKPARVVVERDGKIVSDTGVPVEKVSDRQKKPESSEPVHPYSGRSLHVVSTITGHLGKVVWFVVSQNGQRVSEVPSTDLEVLGYKVDALTPCAVKITYEGWSRWVICDAPQVAVSTVGDSTGKKEAVKEKTEETHRESDPPVNPVSFPGQT